MNIEDLELELKKLESENIDLYQETKRIFGWPLCGEKPVKPECFTEEEFEEDAKRVMEVFIMFVKDLNNRIKKANMVVKKRFSHYENEKEVLNSEVKIGLPYGYGLKSDRILDL